MFGLFRCIYALYQRTCHLLKLLDHIFSYMFTSSQIESTKIKQIFLDMYFFLDMASLLLFIFNIADIPDNGCFHDIHYSKNSFFVFNWIDWSLLKYYCLIHLTRGLIDVFIYFTLQLLYSNRKLGYRALPIYMAAVIC